MKILALLTLLLAACNNLGKLENTAAHSVAWKEAADTGIIYRNDVLVIQKLTNYVYVHTSFLQTNSFGRVDCNGMLVVNAGEAIVFDTPADVESSDALLRFVRDSLHATVKAVIPTHFHEDCVGGLESFYANDIPAYASQRTIALLQNKNRNFSKPFLAFEDSLTLHAGGKSIKAAYVGAGHTADNIIGYFAEDKVVFGGCLIKAVGAGKGNLEDANVPEWMATVRRLVQQLPRPEIVIPGHGKWGGAELLDYTIKLFE